MRVQWLLSTVTPVRLTHILNRLWNDDAGSIINMRAFNLDVITSSRISGGPLTFREMTIVMLYCMCVVIVTTTVLFLPL